MTSMNYYTFISSPFNRLFTAPARINYSGVALLAWEEPLTYLQVSTSSPQMKILSSISSVAKRPTSHAALTSSQQFFCNTTARGN